MGALVVLNVREIAQKITVKNASGKAAEQNEAAVIAHKFIDDVRTAAKSAYRKNPLGLKTTDEMQETEILIQKNSANVEFKIPHG